MIRRVNIVKETSARRRRTILTSYLQVTISEDPVTSANDTAAENKTQAINNIASTIINRATVGELQKTAESLNLTIQSMDYQQSTSQDSNNETKSIQTLGSITIVQQFSGCRAQSKCDTQAIVSVLDTAGTLVKNLGTSSDPWYITATTKQTTTSNKIITDTEKVKVENGQAKFVSLGFTNIEDIVTVEFSFAAPAAVNASTLSSFILESAAIKVDKPVVTCIPITKKISTLLTNTFDLDFAISDKVSQKQITEFSWATLDFAATISKQNLSKWQPPGDLTIATPTVNFDKTTGLAQFKNITLSSAGMYRLLVNIKSSDDSFNMTCLSNPIQIGTKVITDSDPTGQRNILIRFKGDYDSLSSSGEIENHKAMFYNYLASNLSIDVVGEITAYKGSVVFAFNINPTSDSLKSLTAMATSSYEILPDMTLSEVQVYDNSYAVADTGSTTTATIVTATSNNNNNPPTTKNQNPLDYSSGGSKANNGSSAITFILLALILIFTTAFYL